MLSNKKILITNDDGYFAPGIKALVEEIYKYTKNIIVVAPEFEMSAVSQARTFRRGLTLKKQNPIYKDVVTYSLDGTPADCVRFADATLHLDVDYVISGANNGLNMGDDILYSGTLGACFEGVFTGHKTIGVSVRPNDFKSLSVLGDALKFIEENGLIKYSILNINLRDDYKEIKRTVQGKYPFNTWYSLQEDGTYMCMGDPIDDFSDQSDDSDVKCFYGGDISITPLTVDRTNKND